MRAESTLLDVLTAVFRYKLFMSGFAAVRREAFEAVGGYNESVVFEEHVITMDFYRHHFRGAILPGTRQAATAMARLEPWKRRHESREGAPSSEAGGSPRPPHVILPTLPAMGTRTATVVGSNG